MAKILQKTRAFILRYYAIPCLVLIKADFRRKLTVQLLECKIINITQAPLC